MDILRFSHNEILWLNLILAFLIFLFYLYLAWLEKRDSLFGDEILIRKITLNKPRFKRYVKFMLVLIAFVMLFFAAAGPEIASGIGVSDKKSRDVIFALDMSVSMNVGDVAPSRLDNAKDLIRSMVMKFRNEKVALVIFAGESYVQVPYTTDYSAFLMLLDQLSPAEIPVQGTSLASALEKILFLVEHKKMGSTCAILISDGEDHEKTYNHLYGKLKEKNVRFFTVGVGTLAGDYVPVLPGKYLLKAGVPVKSALNPVTLKQITMAASGKYFYLNDPNLVAEQIRQELTKEQKYDIFETDYNEYKSWVKPFLFIAFLLLLTEMLLTERKSHWNFSFSKLKIFRHD